LVRWNDVEDSSITVNVYGIWNDAAVPDNNEIWMECEYLSGTTSSLGSTATTHRATLLTTVTAYTADPLGDAAWDGDVGTESAFKMSATFTPNQKGLITTRIFVGAASATFYIDPVLEIADQPITRAFAA
jgi:hypothetical protein